MGGFLQNDRVNRVHMKYTIYHHPRCQKSRQTLALLQKNHIQPRIVEYLKSPFTISELEEILKVLKLRPSQLIRCKEELMKKLKLDLTNEKKVLDAMVMYPELIQRPIVVSDHGAIVGRPPEKLS